MIKSHRVHLTEKTKPGRPICLLVEFSGGNWEQIMQEVKCEYGIQYQNPSPDILILGVVDGGLTKELDQ